MIERDTSKHRWNQQREEIDRGKYIAGGNKEILAAYGCIHEFISYSNSAYGLV